MESATDSNGPRPIYMDRLIPVNSADTGGKKAEPGGTVCARGDVEYSWQRRTRMI